MQQPRFTFQIKVALYLLEEQLMEVTLNGYYTLILATLVLLMGRFLVKKVKSLEDFNIPEPVAGGLVAAVIVYALNIVWGYSFNFHQDLQTACMLMFFASIACPLSNNIFGLLVGASENPIITQCTCAFRLASLSHLKVR